MDRSAARRPTRGLGTGSTGVTPEPDGAAQPAAPVPVAGLAVREGLLALAPRPKLQVGNADDPAEHAADAAADLVVARLRTRATVGPVEAGAADAEAGVALRSLRRAALPAARRQAVADRPVGLAGGPVDQRTEQAVQAVRRTGTPLAPAVRADYEQAFGADLSSVRVHSGPASARLNQALGARAFTLGTDVFFGDRLPDPTRPDDQHLLAHELAHTLQDGATAHRTVRRLAVQLVPGTPPTPDSGMGASAASASAPSSEQGELVIKSLAIVGRPDGAFGDSMGDHLTAFVTHRAGVEHAVIGRPLSVAIAAVQAIIDDLPTLPGWQLIESLRPRQTGGTPAPQPTTELSEDAEMTEPTGPSTSTEPVSNARTRQSHYDQLLEALAGMRRNQLLLGAELAGEDADEERVDDEERKEDRPPKAKTGNDDLKLLRLQDCIASYLEVRELLPLSVVNWKGAERGLGGKGTGEPYPLALTAKPGTQRPHELRMEFLSLVASRRIAEVAVEPDPEALAIFAPGLDARLTVDQRTEVLARQHVASLRTYFGANFAALADDIAGSTGGPSDAELTRDDNENETIVCNELIRIVQGQYADAARYEFHSQVKVATTRSDRAEQAWANARALRDIFAPGRQLHELSPLVPKPPPPSVSSASASAPTPTRTGASNASKKKKKRVPKNLPPPREPSTRDRKQRVPDADFKRTSAPNYAKKQQAILREKKRKADELQGKDRVRGRKKTAKPQATQYLSVQLSLNSDGTIAQATVERSGVHTKGAHTIAWVDWVAEINSAIEDKEPALALAIFREVTVPAIRRSLGRISGSVTGGSVATPMTGSKIEPATDRLPLMALQSEIRLVLEEITGTKGVSEHDAVNTAGKAEAHYRRALQQFQDDETVELTVEECKKYLIGLCDVAEVDEETAGRVLTLRLEQAAKEYPRAWAVSGLTVDDPELLGWAQAAGDDSYELEQDPDESDSDDSDDSDLAELEPDDEVAESDTKKQRRKPPDNGRGTSTVRNVQDPGSWTD